MARYVALLRGINLGRERRVGMADLREALSDCGYSNVSTLGQSGNVVLSASTPATSLPVELERAIASRLGIEASVVVRTPRQLAAVVKRNPLGDVASDPRLYLVHFLSARPNAAAVRSLASAAADLEPERFAAHGRELYSWHPAGQQRSKLAGLIASAPLDAVVTNRNWNTVTKVLALARG
jgi:uncharacterized protein (DUF1697 family)